MEIKINWQCVGSPKRKHFQSISCVMDWFVYLREFFFFIFTRPRRTLVFDGESRFVGATQGNGFFLEFSIDDVRLIAFPIVGWETKCVERKVSRTVTGWYWWYWYIVRESHSIMSGVRPLPHYIAMSVYHHYCSLDFRDGNFFGEKSFRLLLFRVRKSGTSFLFLQPQTPKAFSKHVRRSNFMTFTFIYNFDWFKNALQVTLRIFFYKTLKYIFFSRYRTHPGASMSLLSICKSARYSCSSIAGNDWHSIQIKCFYNIQIKSSSQLVILDKFEWIFHLFSFFYMKTLRR